MIEKLPQSGGSVLGVKIMGKVTLEAEKELIGKVEEVVQEHGKISLLAQLDEGAGWGIKAGLEDLKWMVMNIKKIDKIAIVSDSNTWKWLVNLDSPFAKLIGVGEKHFAVVDIDAAWKWLKE
ncbi:MAG: STAS/SEC14 domain-containing protein [Proteobacteria bacterium]|nr:STAS/SEC14 domain-containing protein [Pseudomonadota bacterium]